MGESLEKTASSRAIAEVHDWWAQLVKPTEAGQPSHRGELAELRRCKDLAEVLFAPAYHRLSYRVRPLGWNDSISLAAVAGLLAHVKGDPGSQQASSPTPVPEEQPATQDIQSKPIKTIAGLCGTPVQPGLGPRVSELRFQRLVKIQELHALYPNLLRVIHLAGERVPVRDLIASVRYWNPRRRSEWTSRYYEALLSREHTHSAQGA